MLIDWFTVGAQAINFLILVWLLKRFLYRPILDAIDAREKRIAEQLADATEKETQASKERDDFRRRNETFEQQRAQLFRQAAEDARAEGQRLLTEARQTADALGVQRRAALEGETRDMTRVIRDRAQDEVFAIARRALKDMADASLEGRICEMFISRLKNMDKQAKLELSDAFKSASEPALIRSAFEPTQEQRTAIQNALAAEFAGPIPVRFDVAPRLVAGIELTVNGRRLGWSISDYLDALKEKVAELAQPAPENP